MALLLASAACAQAQGFASAGPQYRIKLEGLRLLTLAQLPSAEVDGAVPSGLTLSAGSLSFGYVGQGQTATRQVQLQNIGETALALSVNSFVDSDKFEARHSCPALLAPGATCLLEVEFIAGSLPGNWSTAVAVSAAGRSFKLPVSGTTAYPEATGTISLYAANLGVLSSDYNFWSITPTAKPTVTGGDCHSPSNIAGCVEGPFYWMSTIGGLGYSMRAWGPPPVLYALNETHSARLSGTDLVITNHGASPVTAQSFSLGAGTALQGLVVDPYRENTYYALFRPTTSGAPVAARFNLSSGQVANYTVISAFDGVTAIPSRSMTDGAAVSPDGHVYYRAAGGVYRINLASGLHEAVPSLAMPSGYSVASIRMTNYLESAGIAFDGHGNALALANAQVLKWPLLPDGTFGQAAPIAGQYNTWGDTNGTGTTALIYPTRTFLRQGPAGTAWLVQFSESSGTYSAIRQVR